MQRATVLIGGTFVFLIGHIAAAQEWTRFRGPNGSGLSTATTMPTRFNENALNWKIRLPGKGHSSPVLWGKRIFLTAGDEKTGKRIVLCVDADGKTRWTREFVGTPHRKHEDNSFASATPAVDERHVYVCWGTPKDYLVLALDHDGNEKWRADLGPFQAGHGFGASPIVEDGLVIVPNEQDGKSALVAIDRLTGDVRWKMPRKSRSSYSTPCVFQPKGGPAQLIFTSYEHGITSVDPKTGRTNWERDVFHKEHIESAIGSPIVHGDLVLGACGWLGVRKEVIAVRAGNEAKIVYRLEKSAPLVTTPIVAHGLLCLWSDQGVVTCADAATGKVLWQERVEGGYYGSPVCAGKHLYCMSREGDLVVLAATDKFEMIGRMSLGEGSHATPAIADGVMYLRTFSHLISIGGKK